MSGRAGATDAWIVPELGPSLGRLVVPPVEGEEGPLGARLDDVRLRLVTGVFDLAGAARSFAATGDPQGATFIASKFSPENKDLGRQTDSG